MNDWDDKTLDWLIKDVIGAIENGKDWTKLDELLDEYNYCLDRYDEYGDSIYLDQANDILEKLKRKEW
ncbi:hypothetical protein [Oceanobacillus kimchii]|uniref:Uncharacterized protein n=1 Tax=Oceanobacillus kimchii TaxID=746691 RepID=A0ABQ5TI99_9BACI|nr:hypothetical protein [Oceanobacillus kimchii]GLO66185.1 hypothetical protein MACH08_19690 [Oceanobacillus kimchii]